MGFPYGFKYKINIHTVSPLACVIWMDLDKGIFNLSNKLSNFTGNKGMQHRERASDDMRKWTTFNQGVRIHSRVVFTHYVKRTTPKTAHFLVQ